jgi:hypothetical protein
MRFPNGLWGRSFFLPFRKKINGVRRDSLGVLLGVMLKSIGNEGKAVSGKSVGKREIGDGY